MKKLIFNLCIGIIALNLVSCLPKGSNMDVIECPAVVSKDGTTFILTEFGVFAAPTLDSKLEDGSCIWAHFTLDWDNQQAKTPPYYASNITYEPVDQSSAEIQTDFDEKETIVPKEDLLPIRLCVPRPYHPFLNGKLFMSFNHLVPLQQKMTYRAIVKPGATSDEPVDVYFIAEKEKPVAEGTAEDLLNLYAIDMRMVINSKWGKDITFASGEPGRQIQIRIKYCTGLDDDDVPQYGNYNSTITLSLLNKTR